MESIKRCILNKFMQKITFVINRILHPWCHDDIAVWHQCILLGARKGWPDQWYARHMRACVKAIDQDQHYQIFYDARYETRIRVKSTYTLPHFISSPCSIHSNGQMYNWDFSIECFTYKTRLTWLRQIKPSALYLILNTPTLYGRRSQYL